MLRESTPVDVNPPSLRIALISPKGPLYRHRGGIFGKSLRYMPLTLPTLAALVPPELNATIQCFDEGIADVPMDLKADLEHVVAIRQRLRLAVKRADGDHRNSSSSLHPGG